MGKDDLIVKDNELGQSENGAGGIDKLKALQQEFQLANPEAPAPKPKPEAPAPADQIISPAKPKAQVGTAEAPQTAPATMDFNFDTDTIKDLYGSVFNILSVRAGEHWALNETETEMLAKPTKALLDKYNAKVSPEMMLLGTAMFLFVPRAFTSYSIYQEKKEAKELEKARWLQGQRRDEPKPKPSPEPAKPETAGELKPPPPTPSHEVAGDVLSGVQQIKKG